MSALLTVFSGRRCKAQEEAALGAIDSLRASDVIATTFEPSYVTVGGSPFNVPALKHNVPSLVFEGNIAPHLSLHLTDRWAFVVTPKVVVRMLNRSSLPVRTPSYMPRATLYFSTKSKFSARDGGTILFLTASHHSNGQEDSTLLADARPNLRSGNFSTNYLEAGYTHALTPPSRTAPNEVTYNFYSLSLEYHPRVEALSDPELWARYGSWRLNVRGAKLSSVLSRGRPDVRLDGQLTWRIDRTQQERLGALGGGASVSYRPPGSDDFWLFAGFYAGQDYYNINWYNHIRVVRVGVIGTAGSVLNFLDGNGHH